MPKGKRMKQITYDPVSDKIAQLLNMIPFLGEQLSRLYLWKFCTFNFMIVGASGALLQFVLYELLLRAWLEPVLGTAGAFMGMIATVLIVFLWNYFWNKHWSLGIKSQLLTMNKVELEDVYERAKILLSQKFDAKGSRVET